MDRSVNPELLDELPPEDPRAVCSRRDLQRVNAWMDNFAIMARALRSTPRETKPRRLVDVGAGDGRFLLGVARRLPAEWRGTQAVLLDRLNIVSPATAQDFAALGWRTQTLQTDALAWVHQAAITACHMMVANLFLHHFTESQLAELLRTAARSSRTFVAVEPRRSGLSLLFSRLLWFIGCNQVTRHDAPVSVRAGFAGHELSRLWPAESGWSLHERPVGRFSHLFIAQCKE